MTKRELIARLNEAIEHEMMVYFQFFYNSLTLTGHTNLSLAEKFKGESESELGHAQKLADRVVALGGTPSASVPKFSRPKSAKDMVKAAIKNEKIAIKVYRNLLPHTKDDPVLSHLVYHLLMDEIRDLEDFENLL